MLGDDELDAATHGDHDSLPPTVSTASRNFLQSQWGSMDNAAAQQQQGKGELFQADPFGGSNAQGAGGARQGRTPIDRDGFPMDLSGPKSGRSSNGAQAMDGVQKISENGAEQYDYNYEDAEMEYDGQSMVTDGDTVVTEHTRDSLQVYEKKSKGLARIARKGGVQVNGSDDAQKKGGSLGNFLDKQEKRKSSKSPARDRNATSPTREYTTGLKGKGANKTKVVSRGAAE